MKANSLIAPELVWVGPVAGRNGYASAARNLLLGLHSLRFPVSLREWTVENGTQEMSGDHDTLEWYLEMSRRPITEGSVCVFNHSPTRYHQVDILDEMRAVNPGMGRYIVYTMFETDRIPLAWVETLGRFDEIWVPSQFNHRTFSNSGLDSKKIRTIPLSIDTRKYDPRGQHPLWTSDPDQFRFLSVFEWTPRKGWDVLVRAYCEEFAPDEPVSLTLRTYRGIGSNLARKTSIKEELVAFIETRLGKTLSAIPTLEIDESNLSNQAMPRLYQGYDAFVLTSRGEGWGMPYMEAMAMELPTAAPNWGGHLDFMNSQNSYLIDIESVTPIAREQVVENPLYAGHFWAEPSVASTRRVLREMFESREQGREKGKIARLEITKKYDVEVVSKNVSNRVLELGGGRCSWAEKLPQSIEINQTAKMEVTSTIRVALRSGRAQHGDWHRSEDRFLAQFSPENGFQLVDERDKAQILISMDSSPSLEPPQAGCKWIWFVPLPFAGIPEEWMSALTHRVDEIWVPSEKWRDIYRSAGISDHRIHVIPFGVDSELFSPEAKALALPLDQKFRFLSILKPTEFDGFDNLCHMYFHCFTARDDVALVVRLLATENSQEMEQMKAIVERYRKYSAFPPVLFIEEDFGDQELPGLYNACQAFLAPYRFTFHEKEAIEAMSCGLPVITSLGCGLDDLLAEGISFSYPSSTVRIHPKTERPDSVDQKNARVVYSFTDVSRRLLRRLASERLLVKKTGERAREYVLAHRSWKRCLDSVMHRIHVLLEGKTEAPIAKITALLPKGQTLPQSSHALQRHNLEIAVSDTRFLKTLHLELHKDFPGPILLSSGSFQSPPEFLNRLIEDLQTHPEVQAVVHHGQSGLLALLRNSRIPWEIPVHESFSSGASLLEWFRLERVRKTILDREFQDLRFDADANWEKESQAIRALEMSQKEREVNALDAAGAYLLSSLESKPNYAASLEALIQLYLQLENQTGALRSAKNLYELCRGWWKSYYWLGKTLIACGKTAEGGAWIYNAHQINSYNPQLLFELSKLYENLGDSEKAEQSYRLACNTLECTAP